LFEIFPNNFSPVDTAIFLYSEEDWPSARRKEFAWGLSRTLVRLLPPLSALHTARNVVPGKFAMKSVKQNSYVKVNSFAHNGALAGHEVIKQFAPASFQS